MCGFLTTVKPLLTKYQKQNLILNTYHENITGRVVLVEIKLCSIPEGQGIGSEHDEKHETHTASIYETFLHAKVSCIYQVCSIPRILLKITSKRKLMIDLQGKASSENRITNHDMHMYFFLWRTAKY